MRGQPTPAATSPTAANWAAPAKTSTLLATASSGADPGAGSSAQERPGARPVADDPQRVAVARVTGGVQQARAPSGRALPDPPTRVVVEWARLRGDRLGQALARF